MPRSVQIVNLIDYLHMTRHPVPCWCGWAGRITPPCARRNGRMRSPGAGPARTACWPVCKIDKAGLEPSRGRATRPGLAEEQVMDQHELKAQCLALPGAVEDFPFGDEVSVFKVGGKMFALCRLDGEPLQLSVKCEPELAVQLRATYPAIAPGYHLNKRHWNTITLDGSLPDQMVTDLLGDSYDLVAASLPKARRPT
jgi:predicted DNA-binding protein (MmcQ/YjbR family)